MLQLKKLSQINTFNARNIVEIYQRNANSVKLQRTKDTECTSKVWFFLTENGQLMIVFSRELKCKIKFRYDNSHRIQFF